MPAYPDETIVATVQSGVVGKPTTYTLEIESDTQCIDLDEVTVWSRALTGGELQTIVELQRPD